MNGQTKTGEIIGPIQRNLQVQLEGENKTNIFFYKCLANLFDEK